MGYKNIDFEKKKEYRLWQCIYTKHKPSGFGGIKLGLQSLDNFPYEDREGLTMV